ncbi:MAG: hypothetical protein ACW976_06240 [Candidatus Ranarchaeia archaeon]|jgi:phosphoribosylaminoimidazolecarboxamide formyltransferase/IMP cyclohydrolase
MEDEKPIPKGIRRQYRTAVDASTLPDKIKVSYSVTNEPEKILEYQRHSIPMRYGDNPHQPAAVYSPITKDGVISASPLSHLSLLKTGKSGLSLTNLLDVERAFNLLKYFHHSPTAVVMKHLNPSGIAATQNFGEFGDIPKKPLEDIILPELTMKKAWEGQPRAAFGSIVASNATVDSDVVEYLSNNFYEGIVAPKYTEAALDLLAKNKNLRVMTYPSALLKIQPRFVEDPYQLNLKMTVDGLLTLQPPLLTKIKTTDQLREMVVTTRQPTDQEYQDLLFAWYVCLCIRSNAVVLVKDQQAIGIGTGHVDRVGAVIQAIGDLKEFHPAALQNQKCVMASDAFFPFEDSIERAVPYIDAIIQPGGSIRDKKILETAEHAKMAMLITGERTFAHF